MCAYELLGIAIMMILIERNLLTVDTPLFQYLMQRGKRVRHHCVDVTMEGPSST